MTVTINGSTGIAGVDGSAATPAVQGTDTNTGIFYPASDTIAVAANGQTVTKITKYGIFSPSTVNLYDFMNARYGFGGWSYRTAVGVGTDAGPAINDALEYIRNNFGRGTLIIPSGGIFLVSTAINPNFLAGNNIIGFGSQASQLCFNQASGIAFHFNGYNGFTGGGLQGLSIYLEANLGTTFASGKSYTTTYAILLQGSSVTSGAGSYQPDQMVFSDLYVSSIDGASIGGTTSYWYNGLQVYALRQSPQGARVAQWTNIQLFNNYNIGVYIYNAVQHSFNNIGIYTGNTTGNNFYITGGGSSLTNSTQINIQNLVVSGDLNLTNATKCTINGSCATLTAGSGFNYYDVFAIVSGSVNTSGIGSSGRIVTA